MQVRWKAAAATTMTIHNPTVEQGWLEEGKELEFDSKELFIKHVLRNLPTSGRECLSGGGKCVLVIDSSSRVFTSTAGIDILTLPEGARISIATARMTVEMEKPTGLPRHVAEKFFLVQVTEEKRGQTRARENDDMENEEPASKHSSRLH